MQVNVLTRDQLLSNILYLRVHDHIEQVFFSFFSSP